MTGKKGPAPTGPHANAPVIIPDARIERKPIVRVSAAEPCTICGKTDWCSRAGELHLCARIHDENVDGFRRVGLSSDGVCGLYVPAHTYGKQAGSNGWDGQGLRDQPVPDIGGTCGSCGTSDGETTNLPTPPDLADLAAQCVAAFSAERKQALSELLHLPAGACDSRVAHAGRCPRSRSKNP